MYIHIKINTRPNLILGPYPDLGPDLILGPRVGPGKKHYAPEPHYKAGPHYEARPRLRGEAAATHCVINDIHIRSPID